MSHRLSLWRAALLYSLAMACAGCTATEPATNDATPIPPLPRLTVARSDPTATATPPPPTPTTIPAVDAGMYRAAIDAFFAGGHTQSIVRPDLLKERVVYIKPTFSNASKTLVPPDVIGHLLKRTAALGLRRIYQERPGGVIFFVGAAYDDPVAREFLNKDGLAITVSSGISGQECGTLQSITYLVTKTLEGWQAEQYVSAVC